MAPLKMYGGANFTGCARVLATLFEKTEGDDYVIEPVDLVTGAHRKPEFLALQPFGQVPVVQDGDFTIFGRPLSRQGIRGGFTHSVIVEESRAIARYISDKYASEGTPLFGKTLKDKALVNQWLEVEAQNYNSPTSTIVYQIVFGPLYGSPVDEKVVAENISKLEKVLDIYEAHLAKSKYLAGDFFSMADLSHLPYTHYLVNIAKRGDLITSRKHVNAWWEDISSRPAWKKVLAIPES